MGLVARTKKDVVTEFRCTEILRAARSVFAEKGYHAATIDEIADLAGVAKGTVYCYFPSKLEVFMGTMRDGMLEVLELTSRNLQAAPDTAAKIRAFIRTRLQFAERNREFFRIYYTEFSNMILQPSPVRHEFQMLYQRQADMLAAVIREGIRGGELRQLDVQQAAYFLYDATRSAIARRIQGLDTGSLDRTEQVLADLVWRGFECTSELG